MNSLEGVVDRLVRQSTKGKPVARLQPQLLAQKAVAYCIENCWTAKPRDLKTAILSKQKRLPTSFEPEFISQLVKQLKTQKPTIIWTCLGHWDEESKQAIQKQLQPKQMTARDRLSFIDIVNASPKDIVAAFIACLEDESVTCEDLVTLCGHALVKTHLSQSHEATEAVSAWLNNCQADEEDILNLIRLFPGKSIWFTPCFKVTEETYEEITNQLNRLAAISTVCNKDPAVPEFMGASQALMLRICNDGDPQLYYQIEDVKEAWLEASMALDAPCGESGLSLATTACSQVLKLVVAARNAVLGEKSDLIMTFNRLSAQLVDLKSPLHQGLQYTEHPQIAEQFSRLHEALDIQLREGKFSLHEWSASTQQSIARFYFLISGQEPEFTEFKVMDNPVATDETIRQLALEMLEKAYADLSEDDESPLETLKQRLGIGTQTPCVSEEIFFQFLHEKKLGIDEER